MKFDFKKSVDFEISAEDRMHITLLIAATALIFILPGNNLWINDEPLGILLLQSAADNGHFFSKGIVGSVGMKYPPVECLYGMPLFRLSSSILMNMVLKAAFVAATAFFTFRAFAGKLKLSLPPMLLLFFASPFIWHYSRTLWTCLFVLSGLPLYFCVKYIQSERISDLIPACSSIVLLIGIHPSAIILPFAFGLTLIAVKREIILKKWVHLTVASIVSGMILLWMFRGTFSMSLVKPRATLTALDPAFLWDWLFMFTGGGFVSKMLPEYTAGHIFWKYADAVAAALLIAFGIAFISCGIYYTVKHFREKDFAVTCGVMTVFMLILKMLLVGFMGITPQVHYNMILAVPLVVLACIGMKAFPVLRKMLPYCAGLMLAVSMWCTCMIYIHGGTRSASYGATYADQRATVKQGLLMLRRGEIVELRNATDNFSRFPHALLMLITELNSEVRREVPEQLRPTGKPVYGVIMYASIDPSEGWLKIYTTDNRADAVRFSDNIIVLKSGKGKSGLDIREISTLPEH